MRFREGDHVRITSNHPFRSRCGTIKYIGEVSGFYIQLDATRLMSNNREELLTWAQYVEHIPRVGVTSHDKGA